MGRHGSAKVLPNFCPVSRPGVNFARAGTSYSVMGRRVLVAVALVCVGCGPATKSERPADARLVSIQPSQVATEIVGASPEQERVLLEILAGLGPTPLQTVEVVEPEEGWSDAPDAVALKVSTTKNDTLALWHGFLLGQAFQERSSELGLPPIAYLADFQSTSVLGAAPQGSALTREEAERLVKALRTAAARSGAEVRRIEILKPKRVAFALELQAEDAAGFLLNGFDAALAPLGELRGRGYDGSYIKVVDGDGRTALETAGDASGGTGWVRPDLAGCKWIGLSHPIGWSPPPCPAKEAKSVERSSSKARSTPADSSEAMVVVPNVEGLDVDEAFRRIETAGFRPATSSAVRFAYNIGLPFAVKQEPKPGERARRGSAITLTLLEGMLGLLPPFDEEVVVPQVTGLKLGRAVERAYGEDGSIYWIVTLPPLPATEARTFLDAYCVIRQEPTPGARVVQTKVRRTEEGVEVQTTPMRLYVTPAHILTVTSRSTRPRSLGQRVECR